MSTPEKAKRKRYTATDKREVVDFVLSYNEANGRGGQTAAVKKFGVSPISIMTWAKGQIPPAPGAKRGRKPGSTNSGPAPAATPKFSDRMKILSEIARQIDDAEDEVARLKSRFNNLKSSL